MKDLEWFKNTLEEDFSVNVDLEKVVTEGYEMFLDEIDESIIPPESLAGLSESLLIETMQFVDQEESEWLGVIAMNVKTREWLLQIILKDGEPVLRRILGGEK